MKKVFLILFSVVVGVCLSGSVGATNVTHTFSATSGAIDANISFACQQNSSATAPAFNTNLRLYYAASGNGCSITLTPSNGAIISEVKITAVSTYTPTVKFNVDGSADQTASLVSLVYTITGISSSTSLKIRNANTTNTQLRITSIEVTYSMPSTPTLTSSLPSISGFTYVQGSGPSSNNSFTISGTNLTGSGNITVAGTTNYDVSTDGSSFSSSINYPFGSGIITGQPKTVYVRLKAGLTSAASPYNGENISISGGSATAINVTCSGSVTAAPTPTLTSSVASLTGFTYVQGSGPSSNNSFTISGSNLTGSGNISALGTTNYEVSTDGTNFSSSVTYPFASGVITGQPKTVYVRLKSGLTSAASPFNGENISISGGSATAINVTCSGSVTALTPTITLTPTTLNGFTYLPGSGPSTTQTFTISGANLTANISIAAPTNYEISLSSGSGYTTPLTLTPSSGTVSNTTIYVRLKAGLSVATYNGEIITATSTGAISQTVTCSGDVVVPTCFEQLVISSLPSGWIQTSVTYGTTEALMSSNTGQLTTIAISNPSSLTFDLRRTTSTVAKDMIVEVCTTSQTGTFTSVATYSHANTTEGGTTFCTVDLSAYSGYSNVYLRFRKYSTASTALWGIKNVRVYCSTNPTLTITPITLTNLNYSFGSGPSAEQSFTISGSNLTANISIAAPSNYEISSTSSSGFGNSLTLTQSGGIVNTTTIYVRLKSGLGVGTYNSEDITATSSGATGKTVTCSGSVTALTPTITLTPITLTSFNYIEGSGPSIEKTFTISGVNLTANISIAAPTNYEISFSSGSGYTSPLTLTPSGGTVSNTTVYVRLKAGLIAADYNSEVITASSTGATNKTVTCSGTVTASGVPISLWFQGFEGTASDTWNISTSTGGTNSTATGSGQTPNSQRIRTGTHSWQTNNATGVLELQSTSVSGYSDLKVILYISSTSVTTGNGADASDYLRTFIALDGGAFASNTETTSEISIKGNGNSRWSYNSAENATTTFGTNIIRTGTSGTDAGTIYSKLVVNIPDGTNSVALRINTLNDDGNEIWNLDDIEIVGSVSGPTVLISPTALTNLNYIIGNGPSAEQSFTISGINLTNNISIDAPTNYEISTGTGVSFVATDPIVLTHSGGTVASTTIYVRLKSGLTAGSYNLETITATSTGTTDKTVNCSGTVTASLTSTLSISPTLTEPTTNSSVSDTPAEIFSVFDFNFIDDSGSGGDNIATKISQIVIKQGTGNDVSDWTKVIAYAKLVDNNNKELDGTINTTDITFSNIPNNTGTPDDLGYIADNTTKTYTLKIYFKTDFDTEKTTIDGKNLVYLVDNSCFVFVSPSSNLALTQSVNSGSTKNEIAVVASKLLFSTNKPPASTIANTNTNVEVTANDENGNRDLSSTASITLSKVTGAGSVSSVAGLTKSLASGIYSWTDFRFNSAGTYTITANDGASLTDITSGDILVIDAPAIIWSDNCNPQHTWDVDNGTSNWVNISPTSNPPAYNGNCYKTAAANSQYGLSKEYILTSEIINLTDYTNCQLSFWMWMSSEENWDGGIVEVNSTGLGGWTKFDADLAYDGTVSVLSTEAWSGTKTTWQKITIDLSVMDGEADLQFRFRFKTDGSVTNYGWAVDEMQVTGVSAGCAGPTVQASNLNASNITGTTMDLNFTRGNGTGGVLIVARQGGAVNTDPISGTTYTSGNYGAGSQIGTGNWVVYNGTGTSCTVSGLTSATNYHFALYEYNTSGTCYNKNELIGNSTTICSTAVNVTGATATPASTIVYLGWTNPNCYDEVMIVAKPTSTIAGIPSGDGSAYSAVLNFAGAGTSFNGGKVVYKGSTSPQVVYGLTNGTLYYFKIFTRKGSTWSSGVEVSATPIAGTLAANGTGTATITNGSTGNINGTNIWQRNKSSQIINFVITGVSSGWLQNVQIDLSNFSTNLLEINVNITGNAQYGATTITRTGEVLLINNLNLTNLNILNVSISGLATNNITTDTDLGNKTIAIQTGSTAGSRSAIASSPIAYLTIPFANAKKYTDNGTTGTLNNKGQIVAVEGISTIASGRLSNFDYDQFFIQEGDGAGAKGLCVRKGSSFSPAAQIAHLYIVKGPLDLISGAITGQTDAFKHMTAINTPTHIIDLGEATLPTPYFVYIETLYAMTYAQFEEVDGLLMRIPSVEKESGSWPALGVSSGLVRMRDVGGTNNLRCYIFGNTDVGGTEPTWPSNMATLVYNYDQFDNYKGRQITPVYKMNFFDEIIWNGSTGNGRWSDALNWSPNILPQQTDEVLFDNITGNSNSYSVIYDLVSMQTIKSLRINPTIPNNITLNFPNTCTFSPAITINLIGDAVIIENGGIINADFGATSGDPLTFAASGTSGKLRINNGGRFIWKADQANLYLIDRLSTVAGTEKGIFEFDIQSSGSEAISVSGKTYGSLVLSASDGNNLYQIQGGGDAIIRGDFVINSNVTLDETWGTDYSGTILVGGDFTNNATVWNINTTENIPDNLIIFNGNVHQTISTNSSTMNIAGTGFNKKIQINNTSGGVSLATDIKLNESLTMTSGILNTGLFVVDLSTSGTLSETPTNPTSYITGNVRATRNIGSGSQDFGGIGLEIQESSGANSTVVTRVTGTPLQGNATCCSGNWSIQRYFDIVPTVNYGLDASMRLFYFEHELNGISETNLEAFKAYLPFSGTSPWTDMAGIGNSVDNNVRVIGLSGFSRWTAAPKDAPLPVELTSFDVKCNSSISTLVWSTASEINNDYFDVEKSDDGFVWYSIAQITGAGNSNKVLTYSFDDKQVSKSKSYYRLKQVDFDGKFEYSPIIYNTCFENNQVEVIVYPNPFEEKINISIGNWTSTSIKCEVIDMLGQVVLTLEFDNSNGSIFETINTQSLKSGLYFIKFYDNDAIITKKIEKR